MSLIAKLRLKGAVNVDKITGQENTFLTVPSAGMIMELNRVLEELGVDTSDPEASIEVSKLDRRGKAIWTNHVQELIAELLIDGNGEQLLSHEDAATVPFDVMEQLMNAAPLKKS